MVSPAVAKTSIHLTLMTNKNLTIKNYERFDYFTKASY